MGEGRGVEEGGERGGGEEGGKREGRYRKGVSFSGGVATKDITLHEFSKNYFGFQECKILPKATASSSNKSCKMLSINLKKQNKENGKNK